MIVGKLRTQYTHIASKVQRLMPWLLTMICLFGASAAFAQATKNINLAWNPSTSSGVAGYYLYYGVASGKYTNQVSSGTATNVTVSGLKTNVTYYFAVTAYNTLGLESPYSSEISYTPVGTNSPPATNSTPPTIALTAPVNGAAYSAPANISLAASIVANGHTITKVQFYNGATLLAEDTNSPYALSWNAVPAGSYSLSAKAVYDAGSTVASATCNVTVTNPPTASALSFAATSGSLSGSYLVNNGAIYQTTTTGVTGGWRAAYTFTVGSTGDYLVSALINAPNTLANSLYVSIDSEPTDPLTVWDIPVTSGFVKQTVCWRGNGGYSSSSPSGYSDQFAPKIFNLTQGTHQLILRGREANTQLGQITISPATTLPAPWQVIDIGNVGVTGSASISGSTYNIAGGGLLGGSSDGLRFLYQPMSGDGDIRFNLSSLQNTSSSALAGVMMRETLAANSRYAFSGILPNGNFIAQNRSATGGSTASGTSGWGTAPNVWVRLIRSSNSFYSYSSTDGVNWTLVNSTSISMASSIYFGVAVASGQAGVLDNTVFSSPTIIP